MRHFLLAVFAVLVLSPAVVCGDILFYPIPGAKVVFVLQGQVTVLPGRIVTLRHPRFEKLHFGLENVRYCKVPMTLSVATRRLQKAVRIEIIRENWTMETSFHLAGCKLDPRLGRIILRIGL